MCTPACVRLLSVAAFFCLLPWAGVSAAGETGSVSGELKTWHKVTVTFDGPRTSETAETNPFRDYRLDVTFRRGDRSYTVPGYYAADGNAAESGASAGSKWRVHFRPDAEGKWEYAASFRHGEDVAITAGPQAGKPAAFDGTAGSFTVEPTDKTGRDFRARGVLRYVGKHHLRFAGSGEYFLKGGADSPENFLGYAGFDGTRSLKGGQQRKGEAVRKGLHRYRPHVKDWRPGDPTWSGGKGKGIIGALNYLSSQGVNSVYFLTMNVGGDGRDVWPWTGPETRDRFDCSKLSQWEIVFAHMDRRGIMLHVVTQEQENDQLLDGGKLGVERKLYYRELVARFGHHLAITWNLGEENTNTDEQRRRFARYIDRLDPYNHPIVVHTFPGKYDKVYGPLLGYEHLHGTSLQTNDTHRQTLRWIDRSAEAGHPWVVCLDEIGPAHTGVKPDADDPAHETVRKKHLWGNLMAGGGGVEWYFGYRYPHNDLNLEDFRSRENLWRLTRHARRFFLKHLPFEEMRHADELTAASQDYCLAKPGEVYAVYLPAGGTTTLELGESQREFDVYWYDPRAGGSLQRGTVKTISGPGQQKIGHAPAKRDKDWAVLIRSRQEE